MDLKITKSELRRGVLTGTWSPECLAKFHDFELAALELNWAHGWNGELSFLDQLSDRLSWLEIIYRAGKLDTSPLMTLSNLTHLKLYAQSRGGLDFTKFAQLDVCYLDWQSKYETILSCSTLSKLFVNKYSGEDLTGFGEMSMLGFLWLTSSNISSLAGVDKLIGLESLSLRGCKKLNNLRGIESAKRLKVLELDGNTAISVIDEVAKLKELEVLDIADCGGIASLAPIKGLTELKKVYFDGTTNIGDGDLGVLFELPNLREVSMMNRRGYSHKREELSAFLARNQG